MKRAGGVALISVLLIVALVSALVYRLVTKQALVLAQTRHVVHGDQSLAYALGGESFARQILFEDWSDADARSIDALSEAWAQPLAPFEVEGGQLEVQIRDLDGRFNLNALASPDAQRSSGAMRSLIGALGLDSVIVDRWRDWVDADGEGQGFGAEDQHYLGLDLPYRTANRGAITVSELRLIEGMDPEQYNRIAPHVTVLPVTAGRININTADAYALQSLSPQLSAGRAQSLVESPRLYTDAQALAAEVPELSSSLDLMKVTSDYFEVEVRAEINGARTELTSTLYRNPNDGRIELIARDFGRRIRSQVLEVEDGDAT
ncbi:MAG: type II secretion system minor pseudopilin GspK [Gammaproteobacteria bacterium]|nr:type II secretion system minor pseudopilin GspK [Gammaproteobacteria bacterium]